MNKAITLATGELVTITQVVSTAMSTTVYYDLSQSKREDIYFRIQSETGQLKSFSSAFTSNQSGDLSTNRFNGFQLDNQSYFLIPYDSEDQPLTKEAIPIR